MGRELRDAIKTILRFIDEGGFISQPDEAIAVLRRAVSGVVPGEREET